jgi:hypothetical protein
MYFSRNWEFGSAVLKLRNFGVLKPPNPSGYATGGAEYMNGWSYTLVPHTPSIFAQGHI